MIPAPNLLAEPSRPRQTYGRSDRVIVTGIVSYVSVGRDIRFGGSTYRQAVEVPPCGVSFRPPCCVDDVDTLI